MKIVCKKHRGIFIIQCRAEDGTEYYHGGTIDFDMFAGMLEGVIRRGKGNEHYVYS